MESIEIARNSLSVEGSANGNKVNTQRGSVGNIKETLFVFSHAHGTVTKIDQQLYDKEI